MKKQLLTFCLFVISIVTFAQPTEQQFKQQIINPEQEIQEIRLNLYKAHQHFYIGSGLMGIGLLTAGVGIYYLSKNKNVGTPFAVAGGSAFVVGSIIQLNSFNFIGKAGKQYN